MFHFGLNSQTRDEFRRAALPLERLSLDALLTDQNIPIDTTTQRRAASQNGVLMIENVRVLVLNTSIT